MREKLTSKLNKIRFTALSLSVLTVGLLLIAGCDREAGKGGTESSSPSHSATAEDNSAGVTEQPGDAPVLSPFDMVYSVKNIDELTSLTENQDCFNVSVEGDIAVSQDLTFQRPVNFDIKGSLKSGGGKIIVKNDAACNITVKSGPEAVVEKEAFFVDCPLGNLSWVGENAPKKDYVKKYMNVKTYNGEDCIDELAGGEARPVILNAGLSVGGSALSGTIFSIEGNVITLEIPFVMKESSVKNASIFVDAEGCTLEKTVNAASGEAVSELSLRDHYSVTLKQGEKSRAYYVNIKRQANDLPMVSLYTEGGAAIDSKFTYTRGSLFIDCSGAEDYDGWDLWEISLGAKGRGNASWNYTEKKSYRLKFDEKASVLGLSPDKDWVLVPNYFDKSLIRNAVAHKMAAQMEHLYYSPEHVMVDLFLNGEYRGVYSISDKIEESDEKINLGNTHVSDTVSQPGFLIEIGWDYGKENVYGKDFFDTKTIVRLFVKEPEITVKNNADMRYIMSYVNKVDKAIVEGGDYEQYVDMDALVDWFIIAELTNNTEMAFYRSCYFYKPENGKLVMGPVWDFDMAFGNHRGDIWNYDGWATAEATYDFVNDTWATYLIKDEAFMERVKARWIEKRDVLMETAFEAIDDYSGKVYKSQIENFKIWNIMHKQTGEGNVDYSKYNTYELQVQYIKEFLTARATWIDNELSLQ